MNQTIETILKHRSIRDYLPTPLTDEELDLILKCAQQAPSSINGQQMSIIVVKDPDRRKKMMELCGNQAFIAQAPVFFVFCQDFYRASLACKKQGVDIKAVEKLDASLVGAIDVGLAMMNAINAAESLGLGTVPIGGIRSNPEAVCELLGLPEYVFPLCGLVIGHPRDYSDLKPRLPRQAVVFNETYDQNIQDAIDEYDEIMKAYMIKRTHGASDRNWTQGVANFYKNDNRRDIRTAMEKQGFKNL